MLRILAVGDPHFKPRNARDTEKLSEFLAGVIPEHKVDLVVILGDIFHDHHKMDIHCQIRVKEFLQRLSSVVNTIAIVGNHDIPDNNSQLTKYNSLNVIDGLHPNFKSIQRPELITINGISLAFCPYVKSGDLIPILNQYIPEWVNSRVVFAHSDIKDVDMGGIRSLSTDMWLDNMPYLMSGHIHKYQELCNGRAIFAGTPYPTRNGEIESKSVSLLTITKTEVLHKRIFTNFGSIYRESLTANNIDKLVELVDRGKNIRQEGDSNKITIHIDMHGTREEITALTSTILWSEFCTIFDVHSRIILSNSIQIDYIPIHADFNEGFIKYLEKSNRPDKDSVIGLFTKLCMQIN